MTLGGRLTCTELSQRLEGFFESAALASTIAAYDEDTNNLDVARDDTKTSHKIRDALAAAFRPKQAPALAHLP